MKRVNLKKLAWALCLALALCLAVPAVLPASLAPFSVAQAATIKLNKTKATIYNGNTLQLKLNGVNASKVVWTTSNKKIATVSNRGLVKALKPGTVTISARGKYGKKQHKCKVTVKSALEVAVNNVTIGLGETKSLVITSHKASALTISASPKGIIKCSLDVKEGKSANETLNIKGLKKGTAKLKIVNKTTKDALTINVKVEDRFIRGELSGLIGQDFDGIAKRIEGGTVAGGVFVNEHLKIVAGRDGKVDTITLMEDDRDGKYTLFGAYPGLTYADISGRLTSNGLKEEAGYDLLGLYSGFFRNDRYSVMLMSAQGMRMDSIIDNIMGGRAY